VIIAYQSFEGQYGDNPRVLYDRLRVEEPDAGHVWLADPAHAAMFPTDVETVPVYSPECRSLLEVADVLIANTHTDIEWCKRPGAFYLQTWHGTPLKRIHHDVRWAPPGRLDRLSRDVDRWDLLLSPNSASTPRLRRAFGYRGEVAETGYPRNDLLYRPDADLLRQRVRAQLGIPEGTTAVLYTPTWRDDVVFAEAGGPSPMEAVVPEIVHGLRDDQCLLYRVHSFDAARHVPVHDPRVRDVSDHPDVGELYLAADALITDYSSTMFDFAGTGKPLIFFVPDYERFRDEVRGFYFDLEEQAPGPMLRTVGDLVDALGDLDGLHRTYAGRYRRFTARYCDREDGHATDRVLELIRTALAASVTVPSNRAHE
jgi:CDP-glycerol glycerophosphotransferase